MTHLNIWLQCLKLFAIYYLDAYNIYWEGLKFYTEADIKEIPLVKLCCCMYKNEEKSEKGNELLPYLPR